jgi:hypothetical protein
VAGSDGLDWLIARKRSPAVPGAVLGITALRVWLWRVRMWRLIDHMAQMRARKLHTEMAKRIRIYLALVRIPSAAIFVPVPGHGLLIAGLLIAG